MPPRVARLYLSEGRHRVCDLFLRHADARIGDGNRRAIVGRPRRNEHDAPAFRRKLVRIGKQVDQYLLDTANIDGHLRQDRVGLDFQHLLLLADTRFDKHDTGIDQLPEVAVLLRELEGAALYFRDVEDIRDNVEQVAASARYMGSIFHRLVGGLSVRSDMLDEFREADDGVERRPELMAHIGEEFRLRAAGHVGFHLGRTQCRLRLPARDEFAQICRVVRQKRLPAAGRNASLVALHLVVFPACLRFPENRDGIVAAG